MYVNTTPAFSPITITIETENEATVFWHALNSMLFYDYATARKIDPDTFQAMKDHKGDLFSQFNKQYRPTTGTLRSARG